MEPTGVALSAKVDWAGNGFGVGAYDDITARVISGNISRSGGSCVLVLDNTDGRFWPDNAGSPLYGLVKPGPRCRVVVTYSATTYRLFGGLLRRIVPIAEAGGAATVTLVMEDHLQLRKMREGLATVAEQAAGSLRQAILDAVGLTSGYRDLTVCPEDEMLGASYVDKGTAMVDALSELNEATLTRHFMRAGPDETYYTQYVARDRQYHLDAAVEDTWTDADIASIDGLDYSYDNVVNIQSVDGTAVLPQSSQDVWASTVQYVIAAGGSKVVWAKLPAFTWAPEMTTTVGGEVGRVLTQAPRPTATRRRPSFVLGLSASVTYLLGGPVTVGIVAYGESAKLTLTNTGGAETTVRGIVLAGRPMIATDSDPVEVQDATSITNYGARSGSPRSSRYIASPTLATGVGDHIVWRLKDPRQQPSVTMLNRFPRCFNRELYEQVAVTSTKGHISAKRFEILDIEWSFSKDADWTTVYQLREAPEQSPAAFFHWGGTLGASSSPRLGY